MGAGGCDDGRGGRITDYDYVALLLLGCHGSEEIGWCSEHQFVVWVLVRR